MEICLCLGRIKVDRLYLQIGFDDFTSYLGASRIDLPYKSAMNYALIGSVMILYAAELASVGYDPKQHGINKLRLVAGALGRGQIPREEVFTHLIKSSYRELQGLLDGPREPSRSTAESDDARLEVDDDCIVVNNGKDRLELVWIDSDAFTSVRAYRDFVAALVAVMREHIHSIRVDGGHG